jgi:hypothetical protein
LCGQLRLGCWLGYLILIFFLNENQRNFHKDPAKLNYYAI